MGFAVVDVETTGLYPNGHHRIVEIGVVQLTPDGQRESAWTTLLNPERDLGPQAIHGIRAADVLHAPRFRDIAGTLATLLAGRAFVGHNVTFDARFVAAAFRDAGYEVPIVPATCVCTMQLAGTFLPEAPRTLAGCCGCAGVHQKDAHAALADAEAAAALLQHYLARTQPRATHGRHAAPSAESFEPAYAEAYKAPWLDPLELAGAATWPAIPAVSVEPVLRGAAAVHEVNFLERLADRLPTVPGPAEHSAYLALLDEALLDRQLSSREHDALTATAADLGISRSVADELHRGYLADLARAAWVDGVVTDDERADLHAVAALLGVDDDVETLLSAARREPPPTTASVPRFSLHRGDFVVFTGEMARPRDEWVARAAAAGLVAHGSVTKKVALVVAADPDSLSTKARKAAEYGIPIVGERAFERMIAEL